MKIHLFYLVFLKDDKDTPSQYSCIGPEVQHNEDGSAYLYAWTDDDDLAEEFKNTRYINRFHYSIKKLSKNDYNEFINKFSYERLESYPIISKKIKKDDTITSTQYLNALTKHEYDDISYYAEDSLWYIINPYYSYAMNSSIPLKTLYTEIPLKQKIKDALNTLCIPLIHNMVFYDDGDEMYDAEGCCDTFYAEIDELNLLYNYLGNTIYNINN